VNFSFLDIVWDGIVRFRTLIAILFMLFGFVIAVAYRNSRQADSHLAPIPPSEGTSSIGMPQCRFIYIGGCQHMYCVRGTPIALYKVYPNCDPTSAIVSDRP